MGTGIIALVKAFFDALTAYLVLKTKSFYYDAILQSRARQRSIIDNIEKLRATGKSGDADQADLLRAQLKTEQQFEKLINDPDLLNTMNQKLSS